MHGKCPLRTALLSPKATPPHPRISVTVGARLITFRMTIVNGMRSGPWHQLRGGMQATALVTLAPTVHLHIDGGGRRRLCAVTGQVWGLSGMNTVS